jgi:hypothetical protein
MHLHYCDGLTKFDYGPAPSCRYSLPIKMPLSRSELKERIDGYQILLSFAGFSFEPAEKRVVSVTPAVVGA